MAFDGSAIPIKQDYRFVNGYPAVEVGKTYRGNTGLGRIRKNKAELSYGRFKKKQVKILFLLIKMV